MAPTEPIVSEKPQSKLWRLWRAHLRPVHSTTGVIAALDGLQAVAVLLTLMVHLMLTTRERGMVAPHSLEVINATEPIWQFGATGVHLFFVLSGFLLFLPYARAILMKGPLPNTRKFYTRRALRVLPAYWASLVLLLIIVFHDTLFDSEWWGTIFLHVVLLHDLDYNAYHAFNPPYWTMAVEVHFYALLPLLGAGMLWLARRGQLWLNAVSFALLAAGGIVFGLFYGWALQVPELFERIFVADILGFSPVFGCGMACSFIYVAVRLGRFPSHPALYQIVGVAGLLLLVAFIFLSTLGIPVWDLTNPISFICGNMMLGLGYSGVLLGSLLGWRSWAWLLSLPAFRFLGLISYSLYLWNWPIYDYIVMFIIRGFRSDVLTVVGGAFLCIAIAVPFSFLSYSLFERPFISARQANH